MGSCSSQEVVKKNTVARIESQVVVETYPEGTYLENYGYVKADRFEYTITFTPSATWAAENAEKMKLRYPLADNDIDIRKYVAHKLALLNWLNVHPRMGYHYCISLEDRDVVTLPIETTRSTGRKITREVEVQVVIKGDNDFNKTKALVPELIAPCRELISYADPDWQRIDTNAIRLMDGNHKRYSGLAQLDGEDSPPLEEFTHDSVQEQLDIYYKRWRASMAYKVFEQTVQERLMEQQQKGKH